MGDIISPQNQLIGNIPDNSIVSNGVVVGSFRFFFECIKAPPLPVPQ
jgi:hypothetical protein